MFLVFSVGRPVGRRMLGNSLVHLLARLSACLPACLTASALVRDRCTLGLNEKCRKRWKGRRKKLPDAPAVLKECVPPPSTAAAATTTTRRNQAEEEKKNGIPKRHPFPVALLLIASGRHRRCWFAFPFAIHTWSRQLVPTYNPICIGRSPQGGAEERRSSSLLSPFYISRNSPRRFR